MAHISAIGAGMYSDLAIAVPLTDPTFGALDSAAEFQALFASEIQNIGGTKAANTYIRVKNIREFPGMGTPPNIVNVPSYGKSTSSQIQGQADAPSMELTLNFIGTEWAKTASLLGDMVGDGRQYVFRFTLLNTEPSGGYASTAGGLGTATGGNSQFYWVGKLDAMTVNPQLTDANTMTLTLTIQSAFFGAYTN